VKQSHAGGRKTHDAVLHPVPGGVLERHIDAQLAALTKGMQAAFACAADFDARSDEYVHVRSSHVANAVSIAKSSAALLFAAAKMRASFQHNITVTRTAEPAPSGLDAEDKEAEEETVRLFSHEELEILGPEEIMREIPIRKAKLAARRAARRDAVNQARDAQALDDEVRALERSVKGSM
jgi:hypothetical protein